MRAGEIHDGVAVERRPAPESRSPCDRRSTAGRARSPAGPMRRVTDAVRLSLRAPQQLFARLLVLRDPARSQPTCRCPGDQAEARYVASTPADARLRRRCAPRTRSRASSTCTKSMRSSIVVVEGLEGQRLIVTDAMPHTDFRCCARLSRLQVADCRRSRSDRVLSGARKRRADAGGQAGRTRERIAVLHVPGVVRAEGRMIRVARARP